MVDMMGEERTELSLTRSIYINRKTAERQGTLNTYIFASCVVFIRIHDQIVHRLPEC